MPRASRCQRSLLQKYIWSLREGGALDVKRGEREEAAGRRAWAPGP